MKLALRSARDGFRYERDPRKLKRNERFETDGRSAEKEARVVEAEMVRVVLEDDRASGTTAIGGGDPALSVHECIGISATGTDVHDTLWPKPMVMETNFGIRTHPACNLPQVGTVQFD